MRCGWWSGLGFVQDTEESHHQRPAAGLYKRAPDPRSGPGCSNQAHYHGALRTQPPMATGAPSQTSTIPYRPLLYTIPHLYHSMPYLHRPLLYAIPRCRSIPSLYAACTSRSLSTRCPERIHAYMRHTAPHRYHLTLCARCVQLVLLAVFFGSWQERRTSLQRSVADGKPPCLSCAASSVLCSAVRCWACRTKGTWSMAQCRKARSK